MKIGVAGETSIHVYTCKYIHTLLVLSVGFTLRDCVSVPGLSGGEPGPALEEKERQIKGDIEEEKAMSVALTAAICTCTTAHCSTVAYWSWLCAVFTTLATISLATMDTRSLLLWCSGVCCYGSGWYGPGILHVCLCPQVQVSVPDSAWNED